MILIDDKKTGMGIIKGGVLAFSRYIDTVEIPELVKEIEIINAYWGEQFPGIPIEKIVISGDTEKAKFLQTRLPKDLGTIEQGKPLGREITKFNLSQSASIGLAMRRWEEKHLFDINLIPPEKLRKIEIERKFLISFIAVSLILVTLFAMNSVFSFMLNLYEKRLIPVQLELAKSPGILSALQRINEERSYVSVNLSQKEGFIDQIETTPWAQILADITNFIPDEAWLTKISSEKNNVLMLRGISYSQDAVYKYVHLLSFSDYFYEPNLAYIKGREEEGHSLFAFDIICPLTEGSVSQE